MTKALWGFLFAIIFSIWIVPAHAASVEDFYKGKTIQFIVGGTAGGGYDTYTRLIARHFGNTFRANRTWWFRICPEQQC